MKISSHIALAVLGAGYGRRFGADMDKLGALLHGKPVAHHVLEAVKPFSWAQKILICRETSLWAGLYRQENFELIFNEDAKGGMLSSLKKAVSSARPEITHLFICLADMPFTSSHHLEKMLQAFQGKKPIATQSEHYRGPPAVFTLKSLQTLPDTGEGGARSLLKNALLIPCPVQEVRDIDLKKDLIF